MAQEFLARLQTTPLDQTIMSNYLENIACKAITHYEGQWLYSAYSILQTSLMHQQSKDPQLSQHAHTIQTLFNVADFGWACWSLKKIAEELLRKNVVSLSEPLTCFNASLGASVALYLAYKVSSLLLGNANQPHEKNTSASYERPTSEVIGHHLFTMRIVLNTALACFSSYKALSICNLLGQVYSLHKLSQRQWLKYTTTREFSNHLEAVYSAKIAYHCLLTPIKNNENNEPAYYFCANHGYFESKLMQLIGDKMINPEGLTLNTVGKKPDEILADKNFLPSCASLMCDNPYPLHGYYNGEVTAPDGKVHSIPVRIKNFEIKSKPLLPWLFQGLNLTYTAFQAGLATMQQRHPELAGRILGAQRLLLVADAIALIRDYVQLYNHMEEQYKEKEKFFIPYYLLVCASLIIAGFGLSTLSSYMKPTIDLKETLKKASPSAVWFDASWDSPEDHGYSLVLPLIRIIVNLMSAFVVCSRQSFVHLLNASLQTLTLHKISTLSWIHFTKKFYSKEFKVSITVKSHFLVHADLPYSLFNIYSYCSNFINKFEILKTERHGFHQIMTASVQPEKMGGIIPPFINGMTGT